MIRLGVMIFNASSTRKNISYLTKESGVKKTLDKGVVVSSKSMKRLLNVFCLLNKPILKSACVKGAFVSSTYTLPLLIAHSTLFDDV